MVRQAIQFEIEKPPMPDTTLSKRKPRDPQPTVSDCAIIRDEWSQYVRTCKHEPSWVEIDRIQTFLVKALTDKEEPSALRCASLVEAMSPVMPWTKLATGSLITFCAITELFGILAEKSGRTHVLRWKDQARKNITALQYSGLGREGIVARVHALLAGSQSNFGSLSTARKLDVCKLIPSTFLLDPELGTAIDSLLPTDVRQRIKAIPFSVDSSLNQELIKRYMPKEFDYLDLFLAKDDWADQRRIQRSVHQFLYKMPSQPPQEQWTIPPDAFQ